VQTRVELEQKALQKRRNKKISGINFLDNLVIEFPVRLVSSLRAINRLLSKPKITANSK